VCGARDISALAQAMTAMLAPAVRSGMGRNALSAVADLTPPAMAARLVALYERLLA